MTDKDRKLPPDTPRPVSRQTDRRRPGERGDAPRVKPRAVGSVGRDELGNAVWEWRVDVPRRRDDDPTIDLLQCLDVDGLSIEEDEKKKPKKGHFNPYDKTR
jgi:hypothetical protein